MTEQSLVAIISGGGQGIGNAIARALAARGDIVYVFDIYAMDDIRVQNIVQNNSISYIQVDVQSSHSVDAGFIAFIEDQKKRGTSPRLDLLVNNAGITRDNLMLRMRESDWDEVLDVNLKGAFLCAKQALKLLIKQPKSYLLNISSIVGITGHAGQANYSASKAGLIGFTKSLAQEYSSRNVLVNAIAPGFIETAMTEKIPHDMKTVIQERIPLHRFGTVDDIAALVLFLTSGNADYITGQVLRVDGGLMM